MTNLILCGFQGVGKTTHGRRLAERVGAPFYDTDELIVARFGGEVPCAQIVKRKGIEGFRSLEREVVASLMGVRGAVIALGGGALECEENRVVMSALGALVYLEADEAVVKGSARIEFASIDELYEKRRAIFEAVATFRLPCDEKLDEALERVWQEINSEHFLR